MGSCFAVMTNRTRLEIEIMLFLRRQPIFPRCYDVRSLGNKAAASEIVGCSERSLFRSRPARKLRVDVKGALRPAKCCVPRTKSEVTERRAANGSCLPSRRFIPRTGMLTNALDRWKHQAGSLVRRCRQSYTNDTELLIIDEFPRVVVQAPAVPVIAA